MYTKEQYEKSFKLREEGLTFFEIAKRLNIISSSTVYCWNKGKKKPRGNFLQENHDSSSPELGYILGAIEGDGYTSFKCNGTKGIVGLDVKDKDFAEFFKIQLEKWSGLKASSRFRESNGLFITTLYSLRATIFLKRFDIFSLRNADEKIKAYFLRGMFDSEGGVSGSNLETPRIATRFVAIYNNDLQLLLLVKDLLESIGIKVQNIDKRVGSSFNKNNVNYRLRIGGKENLVKFKEKIGFSIERKNKKLGDVLDSYKKVPSERAGVKLGLGENRWLDLIKLSSL